MGCECSKETKIQPEDSTLAGEVVVVNKRPIMVKQGAIQPEKMSFKEFTYTISVIKKNDIFLIHQLLKNKKPTENLSIYGSRSTYLHYAAKFNAYRAMSIFINWIRENIPDHLYSIINTQDANGRTPAMVCASYSSAESLFILLQSGEVQEEIRDVERRSLRDLCEKHSKSCLIIMKRIKDFGKDFSLANALLSIQRINKLTKIFKGVMDVFTASRKLRSYTSKYKQTSQPSYPTQISQQTEPDSPHRGKVKDTGFGFLKPKAAGKFSGPVIWCKYKRDPGFDRKFQKHLTKVSTIEKKPKFSIVSLPTYAGGQIKKALTDVHPQKRMASHVEELTEYQDNDFSLNPQDHVEEYSDESSQGNDSEDYYEEDEEIDIEENILTEIMRKKDENKQQLGSSTMYPKLETHYEEDNFPNPKTFSILKKVGSQSQNFTDTDFPPSHEVIGAGWLEKNTHLDIVWQRPHEFLSVDYDSVRLFNRIDPHDIEQGQLGVCYLLAALSAVAEFPSRIQKIFVNQRSNPHGVYGVKFFVQGIPTEIVLDDYFPCVRSNSKENRDKIRPIFSKPKGNELWVLILEKAWAKLFGTYAVTETGVSDEAFEYILGVPSFMYLADHQSADEMWKIIYNADRKNYIISASTLQLADNDMGLASSHTYSVISAHKIAGYRILKLRNPWGRFEWNGDFSDYSPLWTSEIKQQVGYVKAEDGMFCMTIEDFKTYFMGYVIAKYKDDWVYSYVKGNMNEEHAQYYKFTVEYPTEVYLRVHQKNERFQDTPGYASVDFRVAHVEDNGDYRLLAAKSKYIDDTAIFGHHSVPPTRKHKLSLKKPGTYIIRVKMLLGNLDRREFTLSAYSPDKIALEPIPSEKEYLTKGFLNLGMRAKHKEEIDNGCYIARGFSGYNLYIYAENNGEQVWTLSMSFPKLTNAKLGKPYRVAKNSFKMVLKPGEKKATYLTIIDLQNPQTYANPIFDHKWE